MDPRSSRAVALHDGAGLSLAETSERLGVDVRRGAILVALARLAAASEEAVVPLGCMKHLGEAVRRADLRRRHPQLAGVSSCARCRVARGLAAERTRARVEVDLQHRAAVRPPDTRQAPRPAVETTADDRAADTTANLDDVAAFLQQRTPPASPPASDDDVWLPSVLVAEQTTPELVARRSGRARTPWAAALALTAIAAIGAIGPAGSSPQPRMLTTTITSEELPEQDPVLTRITVDAAPNESAWVAPDPADPSTWHHLAACESSGDWSADTGNGFFGGLQFLPSSWELVGGDGMPHDAAVDEQIQRAMLLHDIQGWEAWPSCTLQLGYR